MTLDLAGRAGVLATALAGRYRIERELGAGGMATVYLAEDVRHKRFVALKVLHPELSAVLGPERFLKEIELTASLQHPHILPLFDSGEAEGQLYYVMPLVDGETLRARLERERQLPIADALRIATEVADALDYAHHRGVIHRDVKPENILLQGGHALVADFGIALAVQQAGGQRMTQTGLSLGTPQYMAPEQAMGERTIDARADVYALGAVTYEMLAGEAPFTGPSAQAIVAKLLTSAPAPIAATRATVPTHVDAAVLTALAKLPADRFATAAQFAAALAEPRTPPPAPERSPVRPRDVRVPALGLASIGLAVAVAAMLWRWPHGTDPFPMRAELVTPGASQIGPVTLSPDGQSVAFVARAAGSSTEMLYVRRLDQLAARQVPGTESASAPIFSADGRAILFVSRRRKLARVSLDGGAPTFLADVPDNGGADWSAAGDIVAGAGIVEGRQGLFRVSAAGGRLVPFTRIDPARKELSHQWPRILADGRTVLFSIWYGAIDRSEIGAASLDDGKVIPLGVLGAKALGVVDEQLVYVRADGTVMAVPFDVGRRRVTGTAVPVQDPVRLWDGSGGDVNAFLTQAGGLVYAHGTLDRRLVWVDRGGVARPALDELREYRSLRISPDGRRVALSIGTGPSSDLWVLDLASGTLTPVTTTGRTRNPTWTPDGRRLLYVSTQSGRAAFWWHAADGSGVATPAGEARHNPWNIDLSPDGRTVVFNSLYDGTFNLETLALDSSHAEREVAASPTATDAFGRFSPDGRFLAYVSDESRRAEVYVTPFPASGARVQISVAGGRRQVWSRDGRRLYYWQDSRLVQATLAHDPTLRVVARDVLFEGRYEPDFDVSADGTRFLMIESETSGLGVVVVPNWRTELRRLTAAGKK